MGLCQQFKTLSEFKSYCHLNNIDMLPVLAHVYSHIIQL